MSVHGDEVNCPPRIKTLAPMTVSASSLLDVTEDGLATVNISKLMTAKVLDRRSTSSGVTYKCELEPLWLAADLVEKDADGARSHPELRERADTRRTFQDIEGEKAKAFTNISVLSGQLSIF